MFLRAISRSHNSQFSVALPTLRTGSECSIKSAVNISKVSINQVSQDLLGRTWANHGQFWTTNKQNEKCATPMGHLIVGKQNECIISFVKADPEDLNLLPKTSDYLCAVSLSMHIMLLLLPPSLLGLSCFFFW